SQHKVNVVAFSPAGNLLASGSYDSGQAIVLRDVTNWQSVRTLSMQRSAVDSLAFSPDGTSLASASWDGIRSPSGRFDDHVVVVWDVASGQVLHALAVHTDTVNCVAYSPGGTTLASGSHDGAIVL